MKIVIVGGGIGGLALAAGLVPQAGERYQVEVLEAADALRRTGAAVTLYSNGTSALARLGAALPDHLGGRIDLLQIHDERGRRLIGFDLSRIHRRTGFPVVTVPRRSLLGHLADRVPSEVLLLGTPVSAVRPGAPTAVMGAAGAEHTADVLVGADGHRSVVRAATVGGAAARPTGWTTWQGVTPVVPDLDEGHTGHLVVGSAGLVGLMPAGNGLLQWWFDVEREIPSDQPVAALQALFGGYAGPVRRLLEQIEDRDIESSPTCCTRFPTCGALGR